MPSLPLLAGFAVQSLLAVSLYRLVSTQGEFLRIRPGLVPAQNPTQTVELEKLRVLLIILGIIFMLLVLPHVLL